MDTPEYVTSPEAALRHVESVEAALAAAGDMALDAFLEDVRDDAADGRLLRGQVVSYWQRAIGGVLAHPSFHDVRDDVLAELPIEQFADDVYSAWEIAAAIMREEQATPSEQRQVLERLFASSLPPIVASLDSRVDGWLRRRISRLILTRLDRAGLDDLVRADMVGLEYVIPEGPGKARLVDELDWSESKDRPGDLNWRSRMQSHIRTAYTRIYGRQMLRQIERAGFTQKRWISRADDRVRHTHAVVNGRAVAIGATFQVGSSALRYPGDPSGAIDEWINCRCALVAAGRRRT